MALTLAARVSQASGQAYDPEDLLPWSPGTTVRGLTCDKVVDEEEDFDDLVQAGARAVTGNNKAVVRVLNVPVCLAEKKVPLLILKLRIH